MPTHPFRITLRTQEPAPNITDDIAHCTDLEVQQDRATEIEHERRLAREAGWKEGFEEGREAGYAQANKEVSSLVMALQAKVVDLDNQKSSIGQCLSETVCDLATQLAETLMAGAATFDRAALVEAILKEAKREAVERDRVQCRAHPRTLANLSKILSGIETVPDETMKVGGIEVVVSGVDAHEVLLRWDARVEPQIAKLKRLSDVLPHGPLRRGKASREVRDE